MDQLALLCGLRCSDPSPPTQPPFTKCGYATLSQPGMLERLLQATDLPANHGANPAYLECGPTLQYRKLASPSIVPEAYQSIMDDYLMQLETNGVKVTLVSDDLVNSGGPPSAQFSGTFQTPAINPMISNTDPVVLQLDGNDSDHTVIYLTTTALNGQTVFRSDSDGGMYIYQNGSLVAGDQHLNWITNPPALGQEVSSVVRNLLTAMNLGQIKYGPGAVYDQSKPRTWQPAYTGEYYNSYNKFIVDNSNSYGMPYSDAAHSKVQYFSSGNATLDLHVLDPSDPSTITYFDGNPLSDPGLLEEVVSILFRRLRTR